MNNRPNYVLRRFVAVTMATMTIWSVAYFLGGLMSPSFSCRATVHVVRQGETLWGVAEKHCDGHIGYAVDMIMEDNSMTTPLLQPGQTIVIKEVK
jgi:hypothetical protein